MYLRCYQHYMDYLYHLYESSKSINGEPSFINGWMEHHLSIDSPCRSHHPVHCQRPRRLEAWMKGGNGLNDSSLDLSMNE